MNDIFTQAQKQLKNVGVCALCGKQFLLRNLRSIPNNVCYSKKCREKLFSAPKTVNKKKTLINFEDKRLIEENPEIVIHKGPFKDFRN